MSDIEEVPPADNERIVDENIEQKLLKPKKKITKKQREKGLENLKKEGKF
jgi:hypothetical protein